MLRMQQGGGACVRRMREFVQVSKRRWGWPEYCAGVAIIVMAVAAVSLNWHSDQPLGSSTVSHQDQDAAEALWVGLTLVGGQADGVCLDGSPPGYHLHAGSSRSWVVMLEGGGWCRNKADCKYRASTRLGSSSMMKPVLFDGILSRSPDVNPDFHSWTRVKVRYCDGASFAGNGSYEGEDGETLFFQGKAVWNAVMGDLLERGLKLADRAVLAGCSAGALAAMLHCDEFAQLLPQAEKVGCLSDAGFFMHVPDVAGRDSIAEMYAGVVEMQGAGPSLPEACRESRPVGHCFFPQYLLPHIHTPLFVLNPAYDDWQIRNVLVPSGADPAGEWSRCSQDLTACPDHQLHLLRHFRDSMVNQLELVQQSDAGGLFLDSCYTHCQSEGRSSWSGQDGVRVDGTSIAKAVGDWFFDRKPSKLVDCPYPCNPTCSVS